MFSSGFRYLFKALQVGNSKQNCANSSFFLTKQQQRLIQKNQITVGLIQLATHSFWAEWDRFFLVFVFVFQINFRVIRTSVFQLYRVVGKQCAQIKQTKPE